jgi:hypothetical protein
VRIPLAIGAVLIACIFGGWIAGDVDWVIYVLLGAPLAGFAVGWLRVRDEPREARLESEMPAFYDTAGVTAVCLVLWALALSDLR